MSRKVVLCLLVVVVLYVGTYVWFRSSHVEVWARDGKAYVIFPIKRQYVWYLYRPLTYLDAFLTGCAFILDHTGEIEFFRGGGGQALSPPDTRAHGTS